MHPQVVVVFESDAVRIPFCQHPNGLAGSLGGQNMCAWHNPAKVLQAYRNNLVYKPKKMSRFPLKYAIGT